MKIAIIGSGLTGRALSTILCAQDNIKTVIVIDKNGTALNALTDEIESRKLRTYRVGIEKAQSIAGLVKGFDCIISALPYEFNPQVAEIAINNGIHYIDFGANDRALEKKVLLDEKARKKKIHVIPNCGMAPGLVNILAIDAYEDFDSTDSIQIRAAGLPLDPVPPLNYQLSFSPAGLVNEYLGKVLIIKEGKAVYVDALDGYEEKPFNDDPRFRETEAFYTSGHVTTLARQLEGKVNTLEFKTLRYKGHKDIIQTLFDLGFDSDRLIDVRSSLTYRKLLVRQLLKNLPPTSDDIALVKVEVTGTKDGKKTIRTYEIVHDYHKDLKISALMYCTTIQAAITAELIFDGKLKEYGVLPPEQVVPIKEFINLIKSKGITINVTEETL